MSKSRKLPSARRGASKGGNTGNGQSAKAGPGHNSREARANIIREACRKITALQDKRAAINAEMSEIKNTDIKGALGMKVGDFAIALRLHQLDGADRDQLLDTVHETFGAMGVGEQLDWVTASQRVGKAGTEPVDEGAEAAAVQRGPVSESRPTA